MGTRFNPKKKYQGDSATFKHFGEKLKFGTPDEFVGHFEHSFYEWLDQIIHYSPWDGEYKKPSNFEQFVNPLEEKLKNAGVSSEILEKFAERKLINQSHDYYWQAALEYLDYKEKGGADKSVVNRNLVSAEWLTGKEEESYNESRSYKPITLSRLHSDVQGSWLTPEELENLNKKDS